MTKTGKHLTNCAGEWRVGDFIMHTTGHFIMKVLFIGSVSIKVDCMTFGEGVEDVPLELKKKYINITEMQRALGRV